MFQNTLFHNLRKVLSLSAIFFIGSIFSSCEKDEKINPSFESNSSFAFFSDSTKILVHTVKEDSINTSNTSLALFGAFKDSAFGTSKASFYTQVLLPFNGVNVVDPGNFTVDSVVLSLVYEGKYGNESEQTIEVFRLKESLQSNKEYYSNDSLAFDPVALAQKTFVSDIDQVDSIVVPDEEGNLDTVSLLPQLRIRLDPSLGIDILNQSPEAALANNDAFTQFFKGLYVRPAGPLPQTIEEDNILYFALTHSQSKLSIFFTENSSNEKKLLNLPINTTANRFNRYEHFYANSPVEASLSSSVDSLTTYLQSMSGVRPVLTFPELKKEFPKDEKFVINKAELIFPVTNGSYKEFGLPEKIIALTTDSTGRLIFTSDIQESAGYIDGLYDEAENAYHFNIARYLNELINENKVDRGLTFIINGSAVNAQRLIFAGPKNNERQMELELYYSKIK